MNLGSLIRGVRNPRWALYILARRYIHFYEGFTYLFSKNGEEYLLNRLRSEKIKVVFDVGANVGEWTKIALSKFPEADIFGFEISEKTFSSLRANFKNEVRCSFHNIGLSNEVGSIKYKDYGVNSGVNTILNNTDFHDDLIEPLFLECSVTMGDLFCADKEIDSIDLLKIDVEGAEFLVLEGFVNMLKSGKIRVIQFEYGYANGDIHTLMKDFFKLLGDCGYITGPLKRKGVLFTDFVYPLNNFSSGPNFVSVLRSETQLVNKVSGKPIDGYPS